MDKLTYQVKIGEEIRTYEEGTTYGEIAREYQKFYDHDIVLVIINGKLQELHKTDEDGLCAWILRQQQEIWGIRLTNEV